MGAPRIERSRLVWVCTACADRTDVCCDACGTPLADPRRYADGFGAWCKPCGANVRTDGSGLHQVRTVPKRAAEPLRAPPPEDEPAPPPEPEPEPAPAASPIPKSQAIHVETHATSGADYRSPERRVRIRCEPRVEDAARSAPGLRQWGGWAMIGIAVATALGATPVIDFGSLAGVGVLVWVLTMIALGAWLALGAPPPPPAPTTHLGAGPDGLDVEREGEPVWRIEAPRVKRVYAVAVDEICRVRVRLDDGTERELVAGLTAEEAAEVVDQVDRALPGRQAGSGR